MLTKAEITDFLIVNLEKNRNRFPWNITLGVTEYENSTGADENNS